MGIRINSNASSLKAIRYLSNSSRAISRVLTRLATGHRITSAEDDPAGLALSLGLESQMRGTRTAIQNLNNAKGIINTAESGLAEQTSLLQRMRELALQSANGTISQQDRQYLNSEFQEIYKEYNRLTAQTNLNGINLFDGSFSETSIQAGTQKGQTIALNVGSTRANEIFTETVGTGQFYFKSTSTGGNLGRNIDVGDFNNDGIMDVLQTGALVDDQINILLGIGDGTFQTRITYSTSGGLFRATSADFNNDGKLDLVSTATSTFDVRLGNGDGTFSALRTFASGGANSIATGDLNGDGFKDLVGTTGGQLSILFGLGNGSFAPRVTYTDGASSNSTSVADVNNDGELDIVSVSGDGNVNIFVNNGDGTFQAKTSIAAGSAPLSVIANDLNGDGAIDLAIAGGGSSELRVLIGNGNGTFQAFVGYNGGGFGGVQNNTVRAADFNGDGSLDLIANNPNDATVNVYLNNGNGTFKARQEYQGGVSVAVADFNGDGVTEFASASAGTSIYTFLSYTQTSSATRHLNISSSSKAQYVLDILDTGLSNLTSLRSNLGALSNRLDTARSFNETLVENLSAAHSAIADSDVAEESAELTKYQILQQAQTAVLGQANLSMSLVLRLL